MSHETFALLDRLRRECNRAAMATLVRTRGTTPRKEGAKMFVGDGGFFGSVTIGGCVDARVLEQSAEVLGTAKPRLLNLSLGDEEAWEIGLTCGGTVEVFVEPFDEGAARLLEIARREVDAGRSVAIATVIEGEDAGLRMVIDERGELLDHVGRPLLVEQLLRDVAPLLHAAAGPRTVTIGGREVFLEVLRPPTTVVIFGAGAVAIPLADLAKTIGYRTVIVDGRPRFATRERFPRADELRVGIASAIVEELSLGRSTPVVLVAHDYKIDIPVLERVLATDVPYVGLLGSRRRGAAILGMLRERGLGEEPLRRVRVPVGLDLGGESAAEIALSIVSEIVAAMHGRNGTPLSGKRVGETVDEPVR